MIILSPSNTITGKALGNEPKLIYPAQLSNPRILKFCDPSYMALIPHNCKALLFALYGFSFVSSKLLSTLHIEIF